MWARAWGPLCATLLLLSVPARAFNVPKQTDYVTDTAGALTPAELQDLNNRVGDYERTSGGNQIFVLVTKSLEGEAIEDVGYQLIQTWHPGQKGKDNGVVLIIATGERRIRIETGRGVGGDLTDLQANDIIRRRIAPLMRENRVHDAILSGVDGIAEALSGKGTTARVPGQRPGWQQSPQQAPVALPSWFDVCFWGFILFVVVMLLLRASRHPRRRTYWGGPPFIGGGGWGGGGGDWGGGGGDGGSGFGGGGGGEGGGGGSSDSY